MIASFRFDCTGAPRNELIQCLRAVAHAIKQVCLNDGEGAVVLEVSENGRVAYYLVAGDTQVGLDLDPAKTVIYLWVAPRECWPSLVDTQGTEMEVEG